SVIPSTSTTGAAIETRCGLPVLRLGTPATRPPFAADPDFTGFLDAAARHRLGTARVEGAARRQRGQIGRLARDREQLLLAAELRHRAEQAPGVGVLRRIEEVAHRAGLDDLSGIHDRQLAAHADADAETVRDVP